jgi:hypothetical protein
MKITRSHVITAAVCLMIGYWLASSPSSPVNPNPKRPILSWIGKMARTALWISLLTEEPPEVQTRTHLVQVDAEGHPILNHGRGW